MQVFIFYVAGLALLVYVFWWFFKNKNWGKKFTPGADSSLALFTNDLTQQARDGAIDAVFARDKEIDRVIQILSRRTKNNPVLVGSAGVGKTAIVEGLAVKMVTDNVPDLLANKKILSLNLADLISGTKYRGEFEERIRSLVDEIIAARDNIILFIDEVHMLVQAKGTEGAINVSDILKPALARGELHAIGATTTKEYKQYIEPDEALARRFQPVLVKEPTVEMTIEILKGRRKSFEEFHRVEITDEALKAAAELADQYIKDRLLPDKAIDLIDEAGAEVSLKTYSQADSALNLVEHATTNFRKQLDAAPSELKKLISELQKLKKAEEQVQGESELKHVRKKIIKLSEDIEELEKDVKIDSLAGKRPKVTEKHIKKIVDNWADIHFNI